MQRGHRHGDGRVPAQSRLVGRAVELDERAVDRLLIHHRHSAECVRDLRGDMTDGAVHAQSAECAAAIAKIDGLVDAGGRTCRRNAAPAHATREHDFRFDGRPASRIPHAPADDSLDPIFR